MYIMKTGEKTRKNLKLVKALMKISIPDKTEITMISKLCLKGVYAVIMLKILKNLKNVFGLIRGFFEVDSY